MQTASIIGSTADMAEKTRQSFRRLRYGRDQSGYAENCFGMDYRSDMSSVDSSVITNEVQYLGLDDALISSKDKRRERNKMLAKKNRIRKKLEVEMLQERVAELTKENNLLKTSHISQAPGLISESALSLQYNAVVTSHVKQLLYELVNPTVIKQDRGLGTPKPSALSVKNKLDLENYAFYLVNGGSSTFPIIYASPGFATLTGYEVHNIIGRNCGFLHGAKTDKNEVAKINRCILEGKDVSTVLINYRRDGTTFLNQVQLCRIRDNTGTLILGVHSKVRTEMHCTRTSYSLSELMRDFDPVYTSASFPLTPPKKANPADVPLDWELLDDGYSTPIADDDVDEEVGPDIESRYLTPVSTAATLSPLGLPAAVVPMKRVVSRNFLLPVAAEDEASPSDSRPFMPSKNQAAVQTVGFCSLSTASPLISVGSTTGMAAVTPVPIMLGSPISNAKKVPDAPIPAATVTRPVGKVARIQTVKSSFESRIDATAATAASTYAPVVTPVHMELDFEQVRLQRHRAASAASTDAAMKARNKRTNDAISSEGDGGVFKKVNSNGSAANKVDRAIHPRDPVAGKKSSAAAGGGGKGYSHYDNYPLSLSYESCGNPYLTDEIALSPELDDCYFIGDHPIV